MMLDSIAELELWLEAVDIAEAEAVVEVVDTALTALPTFSCTNCSAVSVVFVDQ